MEFKLNRYFNEEEYNSILRIIKSFHAIKTDNGWYMTSSMYKSMVNAFIINIGYDPTEPIYGLTELYQVIVKDVDNPEFANIVKKAQFDEDTGILTMDETTFKQFADFCTNNNIKFYMLKDADKIDIWEKETTMSLLHDIREEMEHFNYKTVLSSEELLGLLKVINENQLKIAESSGIKVKKIYDEIETHNTKETVHFIYNSIDPMILYIKDDGITNTAVLRHQDILTLDRDVAEELVKLKKGEIIEKKRP